MASPRPHVIVIGTGLSGLSAALTAAKSAGNVTILEKEKNVGGNSAKATSGMNATGTPAQASASIKDSSALFFSDTIVSGHGKSDPALVRTLVSQSAAAVEFLAENGVNLAAVTLCGGHSAARTHHEAPRADGKPTPVGWDIISALRKACESCANVRIINNAKVTRLLQGECDSKGLKPVTGVVYETADHATVTLEADAVVLATGGFGNDHTDTSLLDEFAPHLACLPTTNGAFAQGDGVKLARMVGAHLIGMKEVQVHPTGFIDPADPGNKTKFLGPEALRGVGGLLFNHRGRRFVNELGRRDDVSNAMYRYCTVPGEALSQHESGLPLSDPAIPSPVHAFIVLSRSAMERFGPNFTFYWRVKGFFKEVRGAAGIAAEIGGDVTGDIIQGVLNEYHKAALAGSDEFGKKAFPADFSDALVEDSLLYIARVTPSIHYTMGGAAINAAGEILSADEVEVERALESGVAATRDIAVSLHAQSALDWITEAHSTIDTLSATQTAMLPPVPISPFESPVLRPIPGLFGAGEVTGGVHGGNRLAGNSLLECVVFGRIAGARAAATQIDPSTAAPPISPDDFTALTVREVQLVSDHIYLFRLNLPAPNQSLGTKAGQFIAVRATIDGKEVIRYYSPISRPDDCGHLDLLFKVDPSGGVMTQHLNSLKPGDAIDVKGPLGGPSLDFSTPTSLGKIRKIGLIAGGTGIAPMVQILRSAFYHHRDDIQFTLIYAAAKPNQLAFLDILKRKAILHPNFTLHCTVDVMPADEPWTEARLQSVGFVNADMLKKYMFPPSDDLLIILCGPYPMCQAVKTRALPGAGYTPEMFFSYM